jgi:hypothetical protein
MRYFGEIIDSEAQILLRAKILEIAKLPPIVKPKAILQEILNYCFNN